MATTPLSGIYEIVNLENGKRYIGSATNLRVRFHVHKHFLKKGKHHSTILQRSWDKYGEQQFVFRTLIVCKPDDLLLYEQAAFQAFEPEYNICKVAGNALGVKWSEEARAKHSVRQKSNPTFLGRKHTAQTLERMSATHKGRPSAIKGTKRNPDAVAKIAAAHRGMKRSPETRAKIAAKATGSKKPPRSEEHRAKISAIHAGKHKSPAHMDALQAGRARRVYTPQQRAQISDALKAQYASGVRSRTRPPEYREKISKTLTGRRLSESHRASVAASMRGKKRGPYKKRCEVGNGQGIFTFDREGG